MPLIVRHIPRVNRQRRKLVAWTTVGIAARCQMQQKMQVPGSFAIATRAQFQQKANVVPGFAIAAKAQFQQKANVVPGFAISTKAQFQFKSRVPGGYAIATRSKMQMQARAPGGFAIAGNVKMQMQANVVQGFAIGARVQFQFKVGSSLNFATNSGNLVVIDEVYGSDAISRINAPIVATTASINTATIVYISAGARILNATDSFAIELTKPDGTLVIVTSAIQIGTQNFFAGVGRFVPNTYVICVLAQSLIDQRGTYGVQLLVDGLSLSKIGTFTVQ